MTSKSANKKVIALSSVMGMVLILLACQVFLDDNEFHGSVRSPDNRLSIKNSDLNVELASIKNYNDSGIVPILLDTKTYVQTVSEDSSIIPDVTASFPQTNTSTHLSEVTTTSPTSTQPASANTERKYKGVVDSLDNVGFNIASNKVPYFKSKIYNSLLNLESCDLTKDKPSPRNNITDVLAGFHRCIDPIVESFQGNATEMINNWVTSTENCDDVPEFESLDIKMIKNFDEIKSVIYPTCKEENIHVTLGIGHDTRAEQRLNMTQPNTKFYGADPIIEPNIRLFSELGQFFPFAVAREAGVSKFKVLPNQNETKQYMFQDVTAVDVIYFFKEILKVKRVDTLFLDIEGAEQTFLDYFYKGGQFDQNGITICQFNVEIHSIVWENGYKTTYEFIQQMLKDNRYIFLKPLPQRKGVFKQFFINVEDENCVRKFLQ